MTAPTYYEFNERRTQGSVAVETIDWPAIVVTESGALDADQLLLLSLQRSDQEDRR